MSWQDSANDAADGPGSLVCDFLIVGSGGGAFVAALAAKAAGFEPLIIEKQQKVGGTTGYSGGVVWIPENPLMRREGVADSAQEAATYLEHLIGPPGPGSTPEKRAAYIRHAPEAIAFLESQGMKFLRAEGWSDYQDDLPGGNARGRGLIAPLFDLRELGAWSDRLSVYAGFELPMHSSEFRDLMLIKRTWRGKRKALQLGLRLVREKLTGSRIRGAGAALQGRQLKLALDRGIRIETGTAFSGFITDDAGRVIGVHADRAGASLQIEAKRGVLLNCGGFARNAQMRDTYQPKPTPRWTNSNPGDTGEAIRAAMDLGVAMHNLDLSWYTPASVQADGSLPPGETMPNLHHMDLGKPHVIMVDADGRRFADESSCYHDIGKAMYEHAKWPMWAIIDSRHRNRYMWGTKPPGKPPREWLDSGYMIKADSIVELAQRTGIDATGLATTVERFNAFCVTGEDEDFRRGGRAFDRLVGDPTHVPNPCLGQIDKPPFYAVRMVPGDLSTDGGIVTDEFGRALHENGTPVAGLYATGNSTASVMGRAYPGPGGTIGPSLTFGYIAVKHALAGNVHDWPG
jgi:3-oxosteroid 1-dehydrogenase